MKVEGLMRGKALVIKLCGELDECSAASARQTCDKLIDDFVSAEKIIFDLEGVRFMDSTGIGFLIGRYKKASRLGLPVYIANPDFAADKVLNISGIYSLIPKSE